MEEKKKIITRTEIKRLLYKGYTSYCLFYIFCSIGLVAGGIVSIIVASGEYREEILHVNQAIKAEVLIFYGKYIALYAVSVIVPIVLVVYTVIQCKKLYDVRKKGFIVDIDDISDFEKLVHSRNHYSTPSEELVLCFYKYGRYPTGISYNELYRFHKNDRFYAVVSKGDPKELMAVYSVDRYEYKDE